MSLIDYDHLLSDSQAVTTSAVGANVIDLGVARSIGVGEPVAVVISVEVAADQTTGDEDYTFDVEYATDAAQTTGRELIGRRVFESGTPTAPAQDADLLVAGFQVVMVIPPTSSDESKRYLGIRYTTAGTSPAITCSAALVPLSMVSATDISYASGYTIT